MRIPFFTARRNRQLREDVMADAMADLLISTSQLTHDVTTLTGQVDQLIKLNQRQESLVMAATDVADALDDAWVARDASPHLTEMELAPLLRLFHAAGRHEAAELWERLNESHDEDLSEVQDQTVNA
ncbi:hypothetical protein ACGFZC_16060 [[Kitasatospora] papulosa]|uniref:hypothetical protein n=1 Tax=[Kitasatospora] papulosa TaxID=1464011 RepID=UPI00371C7C0E